MDDNTITSKSCVVCSMPLEKADDCACGDMSKDYCKYCGDEVGIYSFEKLVAGMAAFIKSQGIDMTEEAAEAKALDIIENSVANKDGRIEKESDEDAEVGIEAEMVDEGKDTNGEGELEEEKVGDDEDSDDDENDDDKDDDEDDDEGDEDNEDEQDD